MIEELPLFNIPSTFPSSAATPNEVRAYLAQVLTSKHDTNPDYANEVANRWVLGRGSHLRKATRDDFIAAFGREVGGYLYSSVQEDISSSWCHYLYCFFSHWAPPVCTFLALIFLAMACLYPDQYKEYLRYASYCLGPPLFACAFTREGDQRAAMCLGGGGLHVSYGGTFVGVKMYGILLHLYLLGVTSSSFIVISSKKYCF